MYVSQNFLIIKKLIHLLKLKSICEKQLLEITKTNRCMARYKLATLMHKQLLEVNKM